MPTSPSSPAVRDLLRVLATTLDARAAVEIGSDGGDSAVAVLSGMALAGSLTSIENDRDQHERAAATVAGSGLATRVRAIVGDPAVVLPRLADGGYDLVLAQGGAAATAAAIEHAPRLLRPGGMLVVTAAAAGAASLQRLAGELAEDERFVPALLPLDDGVLLATLTGSDG
ncbi:MAG: class I SAM-dependent methyltransferase [Actinobacteria bacterium]|nr:class I SAM-dependent methyltransferase [Actinomycetota bacterium]